MLSSFFRQLIIIISLLYSKWPAYCNPVRLIKVIIHVVSVQLICTFVGQSVVPPDKTRKLFGMLKQSLEQAEDIFVTALEEKRSFKEPPKPRPRTNTQERTAVHSPTVAQRALSSNIPQGAPSKSSSLPYRSHSTGQKQLNIK